MRGAGEQVVQMLAARRDKAFKALAALSAEPGEMRARLLDLLRARSGRRARLPARCAVVIALARETTAMRDAVRAGLGTPELLHELRLNLKEARTILETQASVLGEVAEVLADRARELSDLLGQVNDLATLAELLAELEKKASKKRRASVQVVLAEVRAAHEHGHRVGVRRATREAPALVRAIRAVIFAEEEAAPAQREPREA